MPYRYDRRGGGRRCFKKRRASRMTVRAGPKRRAPSVRSVSRRVTKLAKEVERSTSEYVYRGINPVQVSSNVNNAYTWAFSLYGVRTDLRTALQQVPYYPVGSTTTFQPVDVTLGPKGMEMSWTGKQTLMLRNNSEAPVCIEMYRILCTAPTSVSPITEMTTQLKARSNSTTGNDFGIGPMDLSRPTPAMDWRWTFDSYVLLCPGQVRRWSRRIGEVTFNKEHWTQNVSLYMPEYKCQGFGYRVRGEICHDSVAHNTIGRPKFSLDGESTREYHLKYDGGGDFREVRVLDLLAAGIATPAYGMPATLVTSNNNGLTYPPF